MPTPFPETHGRQSVVAVPYVPDLVSGSLAAAGAAVVADVSRAGTAIIALGTSVFAGLTLAFEASIDSTDGVNGSWFSVSVLRSNSNTIEATTTGALSAMPSYFWRVNVSGFNWLRVRATALTSGSAAVSIQRASNSAEATPGVASHSVTPVSATGTPVNFVTAASTNAGSDKTSAGSLFECTVSNLTAATIYVKWYNKASAPTVGTDVPVLTIPVAANTTLTMEFGAIGKKFATGIAHAVTAAAAATDATVVGAGAQVHATYL